MGKNTDVIYRVFPEHSNGNFIEIGPAPDALHDALELRTTGNSCDWFGNINIIMDANFAKELGEALIQAANNFHRE